MLQITFDLFSGRPNPTWRLGDEAAGEVLAEIARTPQVVSPVDDFPAILGFRGVELHLSDGLARVHNLPGAFRIAAGRSGDEDTGRALAERLLDTVGDAELPQDAGALDESRAPDDETVELLREQVRSAGSAQLRRAVAPRASPGFGTVGPGREEPRIFNAIRYEAFGWDPARWNTSPSQARNNCYCFATDQRIDKFGWPGYAGTGKGVAPPFTTPQLTTAVLADGAIPRADGVRSSLRPRHMFAMVLGYYRSGRGYTDYHFYRQLAGGTWGHKPGNSPAVTTDDAGQTIYDPLTCSRPNYPEFCGYFLAQSRMKIGGTGYPTIRGDDK